MRILYASNAYPPAFHGGAELIAHFHAKTLRRQGHDLLAFAADFHNEPTPVLRAVKTSYEGIPVCRVAICAKALGTAHVNFYNAQVEALFAKLLAEFRPEVVHFHNIIGLSTGIIGQAKRAGAKTVLTVHDPWGFCLKNTLLKSGDQVCTDYTECSQCQAYLRDDRGRTFPIRLRNDFLRQQFDELDAIVSPSQYLARGYLKAGFPVEKVQVIGNGVDLARYGNLTKSPASAGETRFTFLGYLGHHKGVSVLLRALEALPAGSGVVMNFVGGGVLEDHVRAAAHALADRCRVVPWGRIPNERIEEVFRQTDVLISPSIWPENQPGTILEAMATATPVIATRLGGNVELVDDGETGLLFEAGHASALTQRILSLAGNPRRVKALGKTARAKVATFSFDKQTATLLELYREPPAAPASDAAPRLILCEGDRFPAEAYHAIDQFSMDVPIRFALADWFPDDFPPNTRALWVVDLSASLSRVRQAMARRIPVLFPTAHAGVSNLCAADDVGFAYESLDDITSALHRLTGAAYLPMSASPAIA
jgi:glycosyltransferase involved in cell wall biosynthesis